MRVRKKKNGDARFEACKDLYIEFDKNAPEKRRFFLFFEIFFCLLTSRQAPFIGQLAYSSTGVSICQAYFLVFLDFLSA